MTDIVERLRWYERNEELASTSFCREAADEIERLRNAGKAALNDIDGGNDASAYLILKHNFGKADG